MTTIAQKPTMKRRPFGNTGITVSEMGVGGWQLANPVWGLSDKADAVRIVHEALGLGCDFFDTAPGYTRGQSEELIGEALQHTRSRVTICTKFGHGADGKTDYTALALRPSVEGSLRRLRTDYLDMVLLHNPPFEQMGGGNVSVYQELDCLQTEGKVRHYGVSLDHGPELKSVIETTKATAVEVLFNIFHQEPLALFDAAQKRGIGLIVKVPLDSGWLSGKYRHESKFDDIRKRWSPQIIARRAALVEKLITLIPPGVSLTHASLQYILAWPQISTVIPGSKTVTQLRENFAAATIPPMPAAVVSAIHQFWQRELMNDPLPW